MSHWVNFIKENVLEIQRALRPSIFLKLDSCDSLKKKQVRILFVYLRSLTLFHYHYPDHFITQPYLKIKFTFFRDAKKHGL